MVCITAIATHDGARLRRMSLRRALVTRRANLGDCPDAPTLVRRFLSPRYMRYPACVVPLPRRSRGEVGAADLAEQVARVSLANAGELDPLSVGAVVYCHAAPDDRATDSTAGRLQFALGLRNAHPFSISQAHNTSLLIALDIIAGLIEGPESACSALLVAADKLLFGKPPHPARDMVWGDVAAAAVIRRDAPTGWCVVHSVLRHFATPLGAHNTWPAADKRAFARYGAQALRSCLTGAGIDAAQLAAVATTSPDAGFVREVHQSAGLYCTGGRDVSPKVQRLTYASCADLLVCLSRLESTVAAGRPVLAWCEGNNGEFACAVITRIG